MFPSHLPTPRRPAAQSIPSLRWGIIGPGWIAERFIHALKTYSRQQVVAVASRSQAKAERVPRNGVSPRLTARWRRCWRVRILMRCILQRRTTIISRRHAGAEGGKTRAD